MSRFGGSENDRYFLKIPKQQHKLVRNYKRGKLVPYFLNNSNKTCLYGLKRLENIEIEHLFQFKAFFHLTSNLQTSCFSAINSITNSVAKSVILNRFDEEFQKIKGLQFNVPKCKTLPIFLPLNSCNI